MGFIEEYRCLQSNVGFHFLSDATLSFEGPDVKKFLQGALSNDLKQLSSSQALSAFFLTTKGRWVAHLDLLEKDNKVLAKTSLAEAKNLQENIQNLILFSDTKLMDWSDEKQWTLVIGEKAEQCLKETFGVSLSSENLSHQTLSFQNQDIDLLRDHSWIFPAFLILSSKKTLSNLEKVFSSKAKRFGNELLNTLKIESGIPTFGVEVDEKTIPLEAGFDSSFSYTKGCYLGQETISRIKHYGHVNKLLRKIAWQGEEVPMNTPVFCEGKEVGKILNQSFSPHYETRLALSVLSKEAFAPDTKLEIKTETLSYSAKVLA